MWVVLKYKKNEFEILKKSLTSILGDKPEFYFPRVKIKKIIKGKIKDCKKNLLDKYILCNHGKGRTFIDMYPGQGDSPLLNYVELVRWGKFDRLYIEYFREIFAKDNFTVDVPEYDKFGAGLTPDQLPQ